METKKNPKADLGKASVIFFQIGLILVLATTYVALEWKSYDKDGLDNFLIEIPDEDLEDIPVTQLNTPPPPPPPPPPAMPEFIDVVEDELDIEEDLIESTESNQDERIEKIAEVSDIQYEEEEEAIEEVPFVLVANVPIFPGCENEKGNEAQKKCMTKKIEALVQKEFNTGIGAELGLYGLNRIYVVFKIDEHGDVVNIKSRGPHKRLESEAERVVKLLPKMTPGRQRDKAVGVVYSLPILFEVREQT